MIHLDTNFIIGLVSPVSPLKSRLSVWLNAGEKLATSSIAWSEFLTGPVSQQEVRDAATMIEGRIIVFGVREAELAANLYNRTERKRVTRTDCFVAATAIRARSSLATLNQKDFAPFVAAGLHLA